MMLGSHGYLAVQGLWPGLLRQQPGPRLRLPGEKLSHFTLLQRQRQACMCDKQTGFHAYSILRAFTLSATKGALPVQGHIKYTDAVLNNSKGASLTPCLL